MLSCIAIHALIVVFLTPVPLRWPWQHASNYMQEVLSLPATLSTASSVSRATSKANDWGSVCLAMALQRCLLCTGITQETIDAHSSWSFSRSRRAKKFLQPRGKYWSTYNCWARSHLIIKIIRSMGGADASIYSYKYKNAWQLHLRKAWAKYLSKYRLEKTFQASRPE